MLQVDNVINNLNSSNKYMPSSLEKRRAMMMYLFFGIMVSISKEEMNPFEYYHLKQASGWRILFLLVLVFDLVLLFIPVIKYLGIVPLLILFVVWIINVKQAKWWKYYVDKSESVLFVLSAVWDWFIELFEISVSVPKNIEDKQTNINVKEPDLINIDGLDKQMDLK